MRGRPRGSLPGQGPRRTTPARAGTTPGHPADACATPDHPRACGDDEIAPTYDERISGPPPRVRGRQGEGCALRPERGTTPARAGTTLSDLRVYPAEGPFSFSGIGAFGRGIGGPFGVESTGRWEAVVLVGLAAGRAYGVIPSGGGEFACRRGLSASRTGSGVSALFSLPGLGAPSLGPRRISVKHAGRAPSPHPVAAGAPLLGRLGSGAADAGHCPRVRAVPLGRDVERHLGGQ